MLRERSHKSGAHLALLLAVAAGCREPLPVNKTRPGFVKKSDLASGEWYLRATGIDERKNVLVGESSPLERIRWRITEKFLLAQRTYECVRGADPAVDALRSTSEAIVDQDGKPYEGATYVAYPILSHFDRMRVVDDAGDGTAVDEVSDLRSWDQLEFMRVDWASGVTRTGCQPDGGQSDDGLLISPGPGDWERGGSDQGWTERRSELGELGYFEFVSEMASESTHRPSACRLKEDGGCALSAFWVRTSAMRVPAHDSTRGTLVYGDPLEARFAWHRLELQQMPARGQPAFLLPLAMRRDPWRRSVAFVMVGKADEAAAEASRQAARHWSRPLELALEVPNPDGGLLSWREPALIHFGDLRFNTVMSSEAGSGGALAHAAWATDPQTGEIVSSTTTVFAPEVKRLADDIADFVDRKSAGLLLPSEEALGPVAPASRVLQSAFLARLPHREQRAIRRLAPAARAIAFETLAKEYRHLLAELVNADRTVRAQVVRALDDNGGMFLPRNDDQFHRLAAMLVAERDFRATSSQRWSHTPLTGSECHFLRDNVTLVGTSLDERSRRFGESVDQIEAGLAGSTLARDVRRQRARQQAREELAGGLRRAIYASVFSHLMGHTLGLAHNFAGDSDILNWSDRPSPQGAYSTVMDFGVHLDSGGRLGPYDRAAVLFGYGDRLGPGLVEVFDTVPLSGQLDDALRLLVDDNGTPVQTGTPSPNQRLADFKRSGELLPRLFGDQDYQRLEKRSLRRWNEMQRTYQSVWSDVRLSRTALPASERNAASRRAEIRLRDLPLEVPYVVCLDRGPNCLVDTASRLRTFSMMDPRAQRRWLAGSLLQAFPAFGSR